jgi:hypothetical protein
MALLAHSIGFGKPGGDFVIDFVHAREAKRMQMISRRESFDAALFISISAGVATPL